MLIYNLYMGCSVPANYPNYEASMLKVAEALDMELNYMDDVACCGSPNLRGIDHWGWLLVNSRTLAIADKNGNDIITPCNGCFGALKEVYYELKHNAETTKKINEVLSEEGLEFKGVSKPRHLIEMLYTDVGPEQIKAIVTKPFDGVGISIHYGCHLLRPADVTEVEPQMLDELVRAVGAKVIEYPLWKQCCGATVLPVDEPLAIRLARDKIKSMKEAGADFATVCCPACCNQLDLQQLDLKESYGEEYNLPVLFYTQILGLALGLSDADVGLEMNRVPAAPILDHLTS